GLRHPAGEPEANVVHGPTLPGSALCATSVRNGVSKCNTFAGSGTGAPKLPSTRPVAVTYCGRPRAGPGMNLPYGSAASIGMFVTSISRNCRPSVPAACALTLAHDACAPASAPTPSISLPVETGRLAVF